MALHYIVTCYCNHATKESIEKFDELATLDMGPADMGCHSSLNALQKPDSCSNHKVTWLNSSSPDSGRPTEGQVILPCAASAKWPQLLIHPGPCTASISCSWLPSKTLLCFQQLMVVPCLSQSPAYCRILPGYLGLTGGLLVYCVVIIHAHTCLIQWYILATHARKYAAQGDVGTSCISASTTCPTLSHSVI